MSFPAANLFARCVNRCPTEDWPAFLRRYGDGIRHTVNHALRLAGTKVRREELDELMQDLYCRLLAAGQEMRGQSDAEAWAYLVRVAVTLVSDRIRAERAAKRRLPGAALRLDTRGFDRLCGNAVDPEWHTLSRERLADFVRRCRRFNRGPRAALKARALYLVLAEGHSSREVARAVRGTLSASQVDTMVHRFRRRLAADGLRLARRRPSRAA